MGLFSRTFLLGFIVFTVGNLLAQGNENQEFEDFKNIEEISYKVKPGDFFSVVVYRHTRKDTTIPYRKSVKLHMERNLRKFKNFDMIHPGDEIILLSQRKMERMIAEKETPKKVQRDIATKSITRSNWKDELLPSSLGIRQSFYYTGVSSADQINSSNAAFRSPINTRTRIWGTKNSQQGHRFSLGYQMDWYNFTDSSEIQFVDDNRILHTFSFDSKLKLSPLAWLRFRYEYGQRYFIQADQFTTLNFYPTFLHQVSTEFEHSIFYLKKQWTILGAAELKYLFPRSTPDFEVKPSWSSTISFLGRKPLTEKTSLSGGLFYSFTQTRTNFSTQNSHDVGIFLSFSSSFSGTPSRPLEN